jgi:ABC-type Fe3+ transport system permease subunit
MVLNHLDGKNMASATSMEKRTEDTTPQDQKKSKTFLSRYDLRSLGLFGILMFIFSFYMFLPIMNITLSAFDFSDFSNFFQYFFFCFNDPSYRQSLFNALFAGLTTTFICSIIGLTITIIFARYQFFGKKFFQILAILPLVSPPFVGAFALGRLLARNGIISNFLQLFVPGLPDLLGSSLWGIIFMQSIHLWPLIFFNASASYSKIDPAQEEAARNLGSWGLNLYRQIILPLITPGFVAGAVLVFIWSISDLGTPIVLNFAKYAPFVVFKDIRDERKTHLFEAFALVIILLLISVLALLFTSRIVGMKEYAPEKVSGMDLSRMMRKPSKLKAILIYLLLSFLLIISLLPHIGIIIVAFVERIKIGEIIPSLWVFRGPESMNGLATALGKTDIIAMIFNSLLYSILAMVITILFGIIVGYLIVRKKNLKGINFIMVIIGGYVGLILGAQVVSRISIGNVEKIATMFGFALIFAVIFFLIGKTLNLRTLEVFSTMPFAVPGVVLASGYLIFFSSTTSLWGFLPAEFDIIPILGDFTSLIRNSLLIGPESPLEFRFTSFWFIFVISYSIRRMPYVVQSSTAVLRQIHESLEEVAYNLGASSFTTLRRITFPLMASGVLAGGILTLITSFTEVSTSIMITPINRPFQPFFLTYPFTNTPITTSSDPLTKGIYDEINRGGELMPAGVMGLIQLLVAAIGMTITQRLLGEKTGTAFGG